MGGTSFSSSAYDDLKRDYSTKSRATIFKSSTMNSDMNPKNMSFRECRDSDAHPNSFPIIVGLDVTGSMGSIPENLIKNKLGKLMEILISNGVSDASICFLGIGDHYSDSAPLQVGQFESGTEELNKWLTNIYLEGGGGGQDMESYQLAWLFAARHTSTDSFEKRGVKGFIFTIGDEFVHPNLESDFLKDYMGYKQASDASTEDLLEEAKKTYRVFHIHCNDGNYQEEVSNKWKDVIKENLIIVNDSDTIAEVIASTVAMINGADMKDLAKHMDASTERSVRNALSTIPKNDITNYSDTGVINL
jgi:hypothetical protein